jgi:hypothetical protein
MLKEVSAGGEVVAVRHLDAVAVTLTRRSRCSPPWSSTT